jgi:hypothetical protein
VVAANPNAEQGQIAIRVVNRESLVAGARGARGEPGTHAGESAVSGERHHLACGRVAHQHLVAFSDRDQFD